MRPRRVSSAAGRRAPSLPNSSSCERSSSFHALGSTRVSSSKRAGVDLLQARPVEILVARHGAERRLHALRAALAALDDPGEHAHVLAEARPEELAVRVAAEPVDAEDLRRLLHRAAHLQPVGEVVAHVVAAEGEHRHRVAAHHADLAGDRRGGLRAQRRRHVDALFPARRLDDQRHGGRAPAAEHERRDRHARRVLPGGIHRRALRRRHREARVGVRRQAAFLAVGRRPGLALPVDELRRRLVGHAFPPHVAVGRERDVGEDHVARRASSSRSGWSAPKCPARRRTARIRG